MIASPPARLTPIQRRYQTDPEGCLATLQGRADSLFADGYTVTAASIPLVFKVSHEARSSSPKDAAACYFVHALKRTCTCPFVSRQKKEPLTGDGSIVPCKHILGLEKLVRFCTAHFKQVSDLYEYLRLLGHWMGVLAEQHRYGFTFYTPAYTPIVTALQPEVQKGTAS